MTRQQPLIFALRRGQNFARALAKQLHTTISPGQTINFSDGNIFVQLLTDVKRREVILVQSLSGVMVDSDLLELAFYADAAKRAGAALVTAVIPYFSYAKADKHDYPRTSLRARVCADLLQVAGVNRVMMMDLHSPSIPGFFSIPVEHVSAFSLFAAHLKKLALTNLVAVSPDAGFAKNTHRYATSLGLGCAVCDKDRPDHLEKPAVWEITGDIKDKDAVIFDDFTTSGGTLIEVTNKLLAAQAKSVMAVISHAPVTRETLKKITASPLKQVLTTNSVADIEELAQDFDKVRVLDVSGLFAQAY
jgi:ribose-phosphate pyrophosphokinase